MTASGTAGHADELEAYGPLAALGAVVVKSLSVEPVARQPGAPGPPGRGRHGQQRGAPGSRDRSLARDDLPRLAAAGARTVVSIWGRRVDDFARAAGSAGRRRGADGDRGQCELPQYRGPAPHVRPLAHGHGRGAGGGGRQRAGRAPVGQAEPHGGRPGRDRRGGALPTGPKRSPWSTPHWPWSSTSSARPGPRFGPAGGGLSGPSLHPVAVRAVFDVRAAHPDAAIIGVGGVMTGRDAIELFMAGADAVQVGTATFRDPRAPWRILDGDRRRGARPTRCGTWRRCAEWPSRERHGVGATTRRTP